jgi:predicted alpha/beta-hydrolase family hydrolase
VVFRVATPAGEVSVAYTLPPGHAPGSAPALVLAHGAGSGMDYAPLVRIADAVAGAGFVVCRFNFAYREAGRRLPDRLPALTACYQAVVEHVRRDPRLAAPWIAIGGRSLGGRVASHLAADGLDVRALVCLAFPLHPAGHPGTGRAAHLLAITAPMLFVQGTRDALADWTLLEPLVRALPTATLQIVDGANHALTVPNRVRAAGAVAGEVEQGIVAWLRARDA